MDEFYDSLCAGVSGVREISHFDAGELPTRFAAEVKELDTSARISKKQARRVDDVIKYTLVAGKDALDDAGLLSGDARDALDASRAGILVGSAMGGMKTFADACADLTVHGKRMNPFCIPFSITNMSGALLAMDVGFMGPNYSLSTACATANYCMMNSYDYIQRGEADVMLAGGADAAIVPMGMAGFSACKALSQRNEEPTTASRPWDKTRDGFVMGEGAGVLVMEELEHARARGATIYAEFLGGAMTCDAHHMTEPHPEGKGVKRCMQLALERAGIDAGRVNYINAHATSTPAGDLAEYNAIVEIFGDNDDLKINGTKVSERALVLWRVGAMRALRARRGRVLRMGVGVHVLADPRTRALRLDMKSACALTARRSCCLHLSALLPPRTPCTNARHALASHLYVRICACRRWWAICWARRALLRLWRRCRHA